MPRLLKLDGDLGQIRKTLSRRRLTANENSSEQFLQLPDIYKSIFVKYLQENFVYRFYRVLFFSFFSYFSSRNIHSRFNLGNPWTFFSIRFLCLPFLLILFAQQSITYQNMFSKVKSYYFRVAETRCLIKSLLDSLNIRGRRLALVKNCSFSN